MLDSGELPPCNNLGQCATDGVRRKLVNDSVTSDLEISFDDDIDLPPPGIEKRKGMRLRLGRIWMRYEGRDLPISDISRDGMFVETKLAELPSMRTFDFKIVAELQDTKINVPAKAQVLRYEKLYGYAVRYETSVDVWKNLFDAGQKAE